jgi:hypothetical protein
MGLLGLLHEGAFRRWLISSREKGEEASEFKEKDTPGAKKVTQNLRWGEI